MSGGRAPRKLWLLALPIAAVVVVFLFTPVGTSVAPSTLKYCTVNVTITGTFQSNIANYITGLSLVPTEGSCTYFPVTVPSLPQNVFAFSFQGTVTAGGIVNSVTVNIPPLQTSYPFTAQTSFSLQPGSYTITWNSPLPIGFGGSTNSQSVQFTVT